ncbi:hypothetical protein VRRI112168_00010 [Vreelandella rituensis]|uniref:Uncharacterized protein n=1 Tax=Vreelandella rituensis TaxID=2282306 RepID=A0A368U9L6_9GAMM|nr:hypothetical protein [Halomonas rituensis]RCV93918.1 hypothetical protein DU506_01795 [Halomonas rituensis]
MQCKCGSEATSQKAIKSKLKAKIEFYQCGSCTRVSSAVLFIQDVEVATDPRSRTLFDELTGESAASLLDEVRREQELSKFELFANGELF